MVFMPLWDHSPFRWPTPPYVVWSLIVINFIVFFVQIVGGPDQMNQVDQIAGLIPAAFGGGQTVDGLPAPLRLITYQFLHGNFMHLFGNMIFLFVFGDDIEELLGHWRFLAFYLVCGIGAGLAFVLSAAGTQVMVIGASGAVAGVIGAYLLFRPCAKVTCLLGLIPLRIRAYWVLGLWAIWQFVEAASRAQDGVAYWAHVGGFITGAILFVVMRPRGVQLLDCVHSEPVAVDGTFEPPR
ncbi:MAG: rhomboid family intramembrane serine protease [Xanthobacteraceae bacterium]